MAVVADVRAGLALVEGGGFAVDQEIDDLNALGVAALSGVMVPDLRGRRTGGRDAIRSPNVKELEEQDFALVIMERHRVARLQDLALAIGEGGAGV